MDNMLPIFWSGIMGHHLLFVYGFALAYVWEYSTDLRQIFNYGVSVLSLSVLATGVSSGVFFLFFRPHAFAWLGLPGFNFSAFTYFAYLAIIFFIAERFPSFLQKYCGTYVWASRFVSIISEGFLVYPIRFLVFGVVLLTDYFVFLPHQAVAFSLGTSVGFWVGLYAVWAVRFTFTHRLRNPGVSDFAYIVGVIGLVGLLFSLN